MPEELDIMFKDFNTNLQQTLLNIILFLYYINKIEKQHTKG